MSPRIRKTTRCDEILKLYSTLYTNNSDDYRIENNNKWLVLMVYLTGILLFTGYAIRSNNIYLLLVIPIIHIGWAYAFLSKIIYISYFEEHGRYLETIINRIIEKHYSDFRDCRLGRFSDYLEKVQGDFINKPFKHPVSRFLLFTQAVPFIIFILTLVYICIFSHTSKNIPLFYTSLFLCIFYLLIQIIIGILYLKALKKIKLETDKLISGMNRINNFN